MSKKWEEIFTTGSEEVKNAFLVGYIAAVNLHHVYDPALSLQGYEQQACIIGNLIAHDRRAENARRSQARMITRTFEGKLSEEELRGMICEGENMTLDDNGNAITKATHVQILL